MDSGQRAQLALEHPCPRCKAPAGVGCGRPSGIMLADGTVHADRAKIVDRLRGDTSPPAEIRTAGGRDLYRTILHVLRERGDITSYNVAIARRIVRNIEEADSAREVAAGEPMVVGSTGQFVANPSWAIAARCEDRSLADAKALQLTPDTRTTVPPIGATPPGEDADEGDAGDELSRLDEVAARRKKRGKGG